MLDKKKGRKENMEGNNSMMIKRKIIKAKKLYEDEKQ